MESSRPEITSSVVGEFLRNAMVWLFPAIVVLPFYLVVITISVIAEEGTVLQLITKAKGRLHGAVGLLLVLGALALLVLIIREADEALDWIEGGLMVLVTGGVGAFFIHRDLRAIAARR